MYADALLAARYSLDWRALDHLEFRLRRSLAAGNFDGIAAFHALLLPLTCTAQVQVASVQASAIAELARRPSTFTRRVPSNTRRRRLRVALIRGSANANIERIISLLSLDSHAFSQTELLTTSIDGLSLIALESARLSGNDKGSFRHSSLHSTNA